MLPFWARLLLAFGLPPIVTRVLARLLSIWGGPGPSLGCTNPPTGMLVVGQRALPDRRKGACTLVGGRGGPGTFAWVRRLFFRGRFGRLPHPEPVVCSAIGGVQGFTPPPPSPCCLRWTAVCCSRSSSSAASLSCCSGPVVAPCYALVCKRPQKKKRVWGGLRSRRTYSLTVFCCCYGFIVCGLVVHHE